MTSTQTIDPARLDEFMGRFVGDLGAAVSAVLVVIGDKLGLYRAMADGGAVTAEDLAQRTDTDARYVREWLSNQAAGGYVSYDAATGTLTGPYTEEEFFDDLIRITGGRTDEPLARHMIHESKDMLHWIAQQGIRFQPSLGG